MTESITFDNDDAAKLGVTLLLSIATTVQLGWASPKGGLAYWPSESESNDMGVEVVCDFISWVSGDTTGRPGARMRMQQLGEILQPWMADGLGRGI